MTLRLWGLRLTLGLWVILCTKKETGFPARRMASTASSWLASLKSTPSTCQRGISWESPSSTQKPKSRPVTWPHLYDPVSSLQRPVLSSRTVLQDVFDKDAPHHLTIAQPAAHPSAPDDTDAQGLAWLSEELHSEVGTSIIKLGSDILIWCRNYIVQLLLSNG